jgi:inhibitor of cysteine peptidase
MKKKLILCASMAVFIVGLIGCTGKITYKEASIEYSVDAFMNVNSISREVEVTKGGTCTVTLGSNRTTGFQWSEQAQIANATILEQTGHKFIEPQTGTVGAAGKEEWTFKALKVGTTSVKMEYSRPWEGGEKGVCKFELTVTVIP